MRFLASGYATDYKHTNTAFRNSGRWESSIRVRQILYAYKKETYTLNRRQLYVSLQKSRSRRYGDQPNLQRSTVAGRPLEKRKANDQSAAGFWLATKIRKDSVHLIKSEKQPKSKRFLWSLGAHFLKIIFVVSHQKTIHVLSDEDYCKSGLWKYAHKRRDIQECATHNCLLRTERFLRDWCKRRRSYRGQVNSSRYDFAEACRFHVSRRKRYGIYPAYDVV